MWLGLTVTKTGTSGPMSKYLRKVEIVGRGRGEGGLALKKEMRGKETRVDD